VRLLTLLCLLALPACDRTDEQIRAAVTLAISHEGSAAIIAADRLATFGRRAIPTIEAALHTASPAGRKTLVVALRKIGDVEAVPLLRHLSLHDADGSVRAEAEWTLRQWAAGAAGDSRAEESRRALRAIDESRGREEAG
jgi:HEAT repeat protein